MNVFPNVSEERRREMLEPRPGPVRVLIDTDAANEADDQFALTWALLSPEQLDVEAIVAAPYSRAYLRGPLLAREAARDGEPAAASAHYLDEWLDNLAAEGLDASAIEFGIPGEGMERSFVEIATVMGKMGISANGVVFRGSDRFLDTADVPVESEGARRLVEAAMAEDDRVLHVVAIGAVTNIASALLMEPDIATRMVVTWTSGYPTWTEFSNEPSMNLAQDPAASRLLFESGVPLVYLPGYHIGAQLRLSLPEMEAWVAGKGAIGDYLYDLYTHNSIDGQRATVPFPGQSWVCWDFINIAWLLNRSWAPTRITPTPGLDDELIWRPRPDGPLMLEATGVDRDAVFRDFLAKLDDEDRRARTG